MFGYIIPNFETLKPEEKQRYQSVYCGLCHSLRDNYSNISRLTLSYDLTFLVLLLSSLYEPAETHDNCNCIFHPGKKFETTQNEFSNYCADITVAMAYHKILDDVNDEGNLRSKISEHALRAQYKKVCEKIPKICENIEAAMTKISQIEKTDQTFEGSETIAKTFGSIMANIFAVKQDIWAEQLASLGANLGRLIYFMDAATDYPSDIKNNSYNPYRFILNNAPIEEQTAHEIKENLMSLAGLAIQPFEKLPLIQDSNLIQNILYEGIWIRFNYKFFQDK